MKILATGAHFTPALATIEELKKNYNSEVVYVGRSSTLEGDDTPSVESQILPKLGVKFIPLHAGRFQIISFFKIPIGFAQAVYILLTEKPDIVLSFGGYVALPVVLAGWLLSIPIIIHEQGLNLGIANKLSSHFASKIAVSFPQDSSNPKIVLTGNPSIKQAHPKGVHKQILITGGSQGAHVINVAVEECLDKLTKVAKVIHQTGDSKFGDFVRLKQKENENYKVEKFIHKGWEDILAASDLIVCRAGINTLSELAFLGKPALVIPIEGHKEQNLNAGYFKNLGLATVLLQSTLSGESLLLNIKQCLKKKVVKDKKVIIENGAKRLALETILLKP